MGLLWANTDENEIFYTNQTHNRNNIIPCLTLIYLDQSGRNPARLNLYSNRHDPAVEQDLL